MTCSRKAKSERGFDVRHRVSQRHEHWPAGRSHGTSPSRNGQVAQSRWQRCPALASERSRLAISVGSAPIRRSASNVNQLPSIIPSRAVCVSLTRSGVTAGPRRSAADPGRAATPRDPNRYTRPGPNAQTDFDQVRREYLSSGSGVFGCCSRSSESAGSRRRPPPTLWHRQRLRPDPRCAPSP